jgi:hypothetical protein
MLGDCELYDVFAAECAALPLSSFAEVAPQAADPKQCAYLRLSEGYAAEAETATALGWRTEKRSLHHLAMLTHAPEAFEALEKLLHALEG